jgi:hypothetical protein
MYDFTNSSFISHVLAKLGYHKMAQHAAESSHITLDAYARFILVIAKYKQREDIKELMQFGGYQC